MFTNILFCEINITILHGCENEIIINSNNNISINCNDINTEDLKELENIKKEKEKEEAKSNIPTGTKYRKKAAEETGNSAKRTICNQNDKGKEIASKAVGGISGALFGNCLFKAAAAAANVTEGIVVLNVGCVIGGAIVGAYAGYCFYKYFF